MDNNKGFTLIEILIVIVILAIISTTAVLSYITFLTDTNLQSSIQTISSIVKTAQDNSINSFDGMPNWGIYFTKNSITLFEGGSYNSDNPTNKIYTLPSDIGISNITPTTSNPVVFDGPTGNLSTGDISFALGNIISQDNMNINTNGAIY
ncbi:prepilin-type N-terminal cleavage/methylation domain-containing protein [Patescibacteria group bacterium]|nr:prepilin-type N-terminal cleavage/methylation domain-containing protein [Patescibacteria group bacterium]